MSSVSSSMTFLMCPNVFLASQMPLCTKLMISELPRLKPRSHSSVETASCSCNHIFETLLQFLTVPTKREVKYKLEGFTVTSPLWLMEKEVN